MADLRTLWKNAKKDLPKEATKQFKSDLGPTLDKFEKTYTKLDKTLDSVTNGIDKDYKAAGKMYDEMAKYVKDIEKTAGEYMKVLKQHDAKGAEKSLTAIVNEVAARKKKAAEKYASKKQTSR